MTMSTFHPDYHSARARAQARADLLQRDAAVEAVTEFGRRGFRVFGLPNPENRFGFELRVEVVEPSKKARAPNA